MFIGRGGCILQGGSLPVMEADPAYLVPTRAIERGALMALLKFRWDYVVIDVLTESGLVSWLL